MSRRRAGVHRLTPRAGLTEVGAACGLGALVVGLVAACGEGPADPDQPARPPPTPAATSITVTPETITLAAIGATERLSATVLDQNGRTMSGAAVSWTTGDPGVATVDRDGLVTATGNGATNVTAISGAAAGSATVTVRQEAAEVRVSPASDTLLSIGDTLTLAAEALDANGHALVDADFQWSSADESVVTVDDTGLVTAVAEGSTDITVRATGSDVMDSARIVVEVTTDRQALVALYHATNGPSWRRSEYWLTDAPLGEWEGVETDAEGRVTSLHLRSNDLEGTLPRRLGALDRLRNLNLLGNDVGGPIPPELGRLVALTNLDLGVNRLTGRIPAELGLLLDLEELSLGGNRLSGSIPAELGDLAHLEDLYLYGNDLTGDIPPELGNLARLEDLFLSGNNLTGPIPPELGNLEALRRLTLYSNALSGSIPPELGNLAKLSTLLLHLNDLTGEIPAALGQLGELRSLELGANYLTGRIPPELGRLTHLRKLHLNRNLLSGSIPAALGRLSELRELDVSRNELTGSLPAELGRLSELNHLSVYDNGLSGPLPQELTRLPLELFWWHATDMCAPRDPDFNSWLASVGSYRGGVDCRPEAREALIALYDALGGTDWANNANWLSAEPLSAWHGITTDEEDNPVGLDLGGNALAGVIPREIGDLDRLQRLDLSGNRLTGGMPDALASLAALITLDLSRNQLTERPPSAFGNLEQLETLDLSHNEFSGALPTSFTNLGRLRDFRWNDSGLCAPEPEWFQTWLRSIDNHVAGDNCSDPLTLSVGAVHLTQAAQALDGGVPLIAGRSALLRVFPTADRGNAHQPSARAAFFLGDREVHSAEMEFSSTRGLPEVLDPGRLDDSWSATIPGEVLTPGVELVVEIDPDSIVPRAAGSEVRIPEDGRLALDVRNLPALQLTLVPVVQLASPDSSIFSWLSAVRAQGPDHPDVEFTRTVLPVGELDLTVREETYFTHTRLRSVLEWFNLLNEMKLIREMEGGTGYYYGVIRPPRSAGAGGAAHTSDFVSAGFPSAATLAHELGHNLGLGHAGCGATQQLDPDFPYRGGKIGVWGYDPRSGRLVSPETPDVMSYCGPRWISDYNFRKALLHRDARAMAAAAEPEASRDRRLLLWGGIGPDGSLSFDPAFVLEAPAKLPDGGGPYRLEGFGADGSREFSVDFSPDRVAHGGSGFLFLIPWEDDWADSLDRIVLSGPEGTATLDGASEIPMAIVVDRATGRVRAVVRGEEDVAGLAAAGVATGPVAAELRRDAEILVSYGLPGKVPD